MPPDQPACGTAIVVLLKLLCCPVGARVDPGGVPGGGPDNFSTINAAEWEPALTQLQVRPVFVAVHITEDCLPP